MSNKNCQILQSKRNIYKIIFSRINDKDFNFLEEINKNISLYENNYKSIYVNLERNRKKLLEELELICLYNDKLEKLRSCNSSFSLAYKKELNSMDKKENLEKKIERVELKLKTINLRIEKLKEYCDKFISCDMQNQIFTAIEEIKPKKRGKNK